MVKARKRLLVQTGFGGFYNANAARLILAEVTREHGQPAVDALIRELNPVGIFSFKPGIRFEGGLAIRDGA